MKLEIAFTSRTPYSGDDDTLNRSTNIEFEIRNERESVLTLVSEFNKFLKMNNFDYAVEISGE